jgi:hypothetical protein
MIFWHNVTLQLFLSFCTSWILLGSKLRCVQPGSGLFEGRKPGLTTLNHVLVNVSLLTDFSSGRSSCELLNSVHSMTPLAQWGSGPVPFK